MPDSARSKHRWARAGGGVLVVAVLVAACFAPPGARATGLSQAQQHERHNIFSVFQQRVPRGQQSHALTMIKTDDQSAPTPSPPTPVPNSHRCARHTDCANGEYCRRGIGGPSVCSECIDYRNYRCEDWQDSIDAQCAVCDRADASQSRPQQASNHRQTPHHHEQYQHSEQQARNHERGASHHEQQYHHEQRQHSQKQGRSHERGANHHEQQHNHHSHGDQAQRDNLPSGWRRGGDNGARSFVGSMFWGCFKASLFIFGTNCFFWLLCFVSTSIMWAIDSLTSWGCNSIATVSTYDEDAALQAALVASLLSSQHVPSQQQPPRDAAARRDGGGANAGCCIRRCLGRLVLLPVFMMSLCCPLCMFISAAFLFSGCCGWGCGGRGYRCSNPCSSSRRYGGHGLRDPRFRCGGTTGPAEETQQQQSNTEQTSRRTSALAAPHAGSTATIEPLLQEVVSNGEADEEDVPVQCAIAASLSQHPAASLEPEPEPEPRKEQDTQTDIVHVQLAKVKDQKTGQAGGCVAAGFVEVVMDTDE